MWISWSTISYSHLCSSALLLFCTVFWCYAFSLVAQAILRFTDVLGSTAWASACLVLHVWALQVSAATPGWTATFRRVNSVAFNNAAYCP